ncbi:MAG: HEAT repeat domain-containing protein [Cyanobacteria bacterium P01_H01_bin.121]
MQTPQILALTLSLVGLLSPSPQAIAAASSSAQANTRDSQGLRSALSSRGSDPFILAQADPPLQQGDSGEAVNRLQTSLQQLGYLERTTGQFDQTTMAAVSKFQQDHQIPASGVVGQPTWDQLTTAIAALPTTQAQNSTADPASAPGAGATDPGQAAPVTESAAQTQAQSGGLPIVWLIFFGVISVGCIGVGLALFTARRKSSAHAQRLAVHQQKHRQHLPTESRGWPEPVDVPGLPSESLAADEVRAQTIGTTGSEMSENPIPAPPPVQNAAGRAGQLRKTTPQNSIQTPFQGALAAPEVDSTADLTTVKLDVFQETLQKLNSTNPVKRRKAIWELGQRGDSRAIKPLVNLMMDSDSHQRSLILAALSEIGMSTMRPMQKALAISLQDKNPEVRKNAIRDLTRLYDLVGQITHLLNYAVEDEDQEVRATAQWALNQLGQAKVGGGFNQVPMVIKSVSPPEQLPSDQNGFN